MAFTDMCKHGAKEDIDHLVKEKGLTKTAAIEQIAKEADISVRTLERIVWPEKGHAKTGGKTALRPEPTTALGTIEVKGHRIKFGFGKFKTDDNVIDVLEIRDFKISKKGKPEEKEKATKNSFIIPIGLVPQFATILGSDAVKEYLSAAAAKAPVVRKASKSNKPKGAPKPEAPATEPPPTAEEIKERVAKFVEENPKTTAEAPETPAAK